jgi:hypothetical protein
VCEPAKKKSEVAGERTENIEWDAMIAGLVQNTSLTTKDIKDLTIGEIEELFEGINKNNRTDDVDGNERPLEGAEAVNELKRLGFLSA